MSIAGLISSSLENHMALYSAGYCDSGSMRRFGTSHRVEEGSITFHYGYQVVCGFFF